MPARAARSICPGETTATLAGVRALSVDVRIPPSTFHGEHSVEKNKEIVVRLVLIDEGVTPATLRIRGFDPPFMRACDSCRSSADSAMVTRAGEFSPHGLWVVTDDSKRMTALLRVPW